MRRARAVGLVVLVATAAGCSFVRLQPAGQRVRVLGEVAPSCERRGELEVTMTRRIATIERNPLIVREELETLARNAAAGLGGNAVQALAPPQAGRQRYAVWRCLQ